MSSTLSLRYTRISPMVTISCTMSKAMTLKREGEGVGGGVALVGFSLKPRRCGRDDDSNDLRRAT